MAVGGAATQSVTAPCWAFSVSPSCQTCIGCCIPAGQLDCDSPRGLIRLNLSLPIHPAMPQQGPSRKRQVDLRDLVIADGADFAELGVA